MITDALTYLGEGATNAPFSLSNRSTSPGTYYSNAVDLGYLRDIGDGTDLYMVFTIPVEILSVTGAGSITFDPILTSDGVSANILVLGTSGPLATGTTAGTGVPAGTVIAFRINPIALSATRIAGTQAPWTDPDGAGANVARQTFFRRYLQARVVVATNNTATNTACIVNIDVVTDVQAYQRAYASAFTVI